MKCSQRQCPVHEPDDLFCALCSKPLSPDTVEPAVTAIPIPEAGQGIALGARPPVTPVEPLPAPLASGRRQRFVPTECSHCHAPARQPDGSSTFDDEGF